MKKRRLQQTILIAIMLITLVADILLSSVGVDSYYAESTTATDIDYVGNKLPSTSTVSSKTFTALSKKYSSSIINYDTRGSVKALGLGAQAFGKLEGVREDATYDGLTNLVFNMLYCDNTKLKRSVSLNELPTAKSLVHDYLYGGSSEKIATAIANSMLCSDYAVTLSNFNSSEAAMTKDGYDYYGPFKITDNTLGFSEFSCDQVKLVTINKNKIEETEYAESDKFYYFQIKEGTDINTTASFEGVHFNPALMIYDNAVIACGQVINKASKISVVLGNSKLDSNNTDLQNGEVTEDAINAGNIIIATPDHYREISVNVEDDSLAGGTVYLMYDTGTDARCIRKEMDEGKKSVSIAVPNTSFNCDIVVYNDITYGYTKSSVSIGENATSVTLHNAEEHYAKEKTLIVENLTECSEWNLGELTYNLFYTYNGKSLPICEPYSSGKWSTDYKISQNIYNDYVLQLFDENVCVSTKTTSKGYTINKDINWDTDDEIDVTAEGDEANCTNNFVLNLKAAEGISCNKFKVTYVYNNDEKVTKEVSDKLADSFLFTKLGAETLRIESVQMYYKNQWVYAKFDNPRSYCYDATYKGREMEVTLVCEPDILNANVSPTAIPTSMPLPTNEPGLDPDKPISGNTSVTVHFTADRQAVKVNSVDYRLCYSEGFMSEVKTIEVNDDSVTINSEGAIQMVITSVSAEGYTMSPVSIDFTSGSTQFGITLYKSMAKVILKITDKGNSKVQNGTAILTNQSTQAVYQSVIEGGEQVCYVEPGTYTLSFETNEDCYVVNSTITDLPLNANDDNVVEFITTDVPSSAYFTVRNTGGTSLEGVKIQIDDTNVFTTDESGTAEIADLTYGKHTYSVLEVPDGYIIPATGSFKTDDTGACAVDIIISRRTGNLRVNKMVAGSNVFVKDAVYTVTAEEAPYFTKTLSVSEFPISLESGNYLVKEIIPGEGYSFSDEKTQEVTIPEDGSAQSVTFTTVGQTGSLLISNYSVSGYNDKVSGVTYSLCNLDGEEVDTETSDENGKVLFEKVPLGSYTLKQTEVPESYVRYKKFVSIKLNEAGATVSYDAILAQVSGSITVYNEAPVAGILYYLYDSENKMVDAVYTDSDGIALFNQLLPGTYTVSCANTTSIENTDNDSLFSAFKPLLLYAFSGTATVSINTPNVVVGSNKQSNITSTQIGTTIIIPSDKADEYDKTVAGVVNYGSINIDSIAKVISERSEPVDNTGDITETAIDNITETKDNDGDDNTSVKGTHYTTSAGNIIISDSNQSIGDADFKLSESDIASLLNTSVKLPKTGAFASRTFVLCMWLLLIQFVILVLVSKEDLQALGKKFS